jgi:hypothetical protein
MDSIAQFSAAFGAGCLCGSRRPSGVMKIVKAKRILTGLPDDRKNFSCPQSCAAKKLRHIVLLSVPRYHSKLPDNNHRASAHFPKGVPL